jgi:hypothetical protein
VCVQLVAPDDVTEENLLNVKKEKKKPYGQQQQQTHRKKFDVYLRPLIFTLVYIFSSPLWQNNIHGDPIPYDDDDATPQEEEKEEEEKDDDDDDMHQKKVIDERARALKGRWIVAHIFASSSQPLLSPKEEEEEEEGGVIGRNFVYSELREKGEKEKRKRGRR